MVYCLLLRAALVACIVQKPSVPQIFSSTCPAMMTTFGECNLRTSIDEPHSWLSCMLVWGTIGQNMWSDLLCIQGSLNSNCYIREVLEPDILSLLQTTLYFIFQQDIAQPHVARIVQTFFEEGWVSLLLWPVCLPDKHPLSMSGLWWISNLFVMVS